MSTDEFLALVFVARQKHKERELMQLLPETTNERKHPIETETGDYRAVGSKDECRKSHLLCGACVLDFALNPTNTVCPICRCPLEHAVQLCHDWLVERERAAYMRSQTRTLRELGESFVTQIRRVYVEHIERATDTALQRSYYRLWPETNRGTYSVGIRVIGVHTDTIEWCYKQNDSRLERRCQVPIDFRVGHCSETTNRPSVTLSSNDWQHLCHDLFGIQIEPIAFSLSKIGERKRKLCFTNIDRETTYISRSRRRRRISGTPDNVENNTVDVTNSVADDLTTTLDVTDTNGNDNNNNNTSNNDNNNNNGCRNGYGSEERQKSHFSLSEEESDILAAQERFNSICEDFEDDMRYNTRAPRRDEIVMLMRRRHTTSHCDNDDQIQ